MKKITILVAFSCALIIGMTYLPKLMYVITFKEQTLELNPDNDVFAFDLHGVVFRPDYKHMVLRSVEAADWPFVQYVLTHPRVIYDLFALRHESSVPEQYITDISQKHPPLKNYIEPALDIVNEQIPIVSTVEYIKYLKDLGFKVYVFSNIGRHTFEKFKPGFEYIFSMFDGFSVTEPDDKWVQKPHESAYYKFLQTFNLKAEQVTFVDDQQNNINTGKKVGMKTIHYRCPQDLAKIRVP